MARFITLKFPGKCADCGAALPVGTKARWYGRGKVYGTTCHEQRTRASRKPWDARAAELQAAGADPEWAAERAVDEARGGKLVWWGGQQVRGTHCEDAPCCGCCGPGSDDPAYQPYEPEEREF
jgi:hypothetical protein